MDTTSFTQHLEASASAIFKKISSSTDQKTVANFGRAAAITWAMYIVASKLYSAFLGPLSSIPGPLGLKFYGVRFTPGIEDPPGTSYKKLKAWHAKYGSIVRLGPNCINIADKRMLQEIFRNDEVYLKGPMYIRLQKRSPPDLLSTIDRAKHKQRRRVLSPAFAVKYLNSLETYMLKTTQAFFDRIDRDIAKTSNEQGYGQVDIWILVHYLALDIIGEAAFGKTFNMLEGNDHLVPRTITKNMKMLHYLVTHPISGPLKLMLPASSRGILKANSELKEFMKEVIMERLVGGEKARRNDILQILIDTQHASNSEDRLTASAIAQETVLFLTAGSETTSNSMGFVVVELMTNPQALVKLRQEVDAIDFKPGHKLLLHEQVKHLPYLNAVINETLRLDAVVVGALERVPTRDVVIDGRLFVPKGMDPAYWPEPEKWIPERWVPGSGAPPADTEAFLPFSTGPRNCVGKTFAEQEMRLSIANLIKLYDFQAIPEEVAASKDRCAFLTLTVKKNSYKVLVKRRVSGI
ncbi:cytochrome P450 [Zychaea mexicana]|uniref:cytochrome P450 n=1 Tax=Zychaea mexicana TaxID=64656 RepID=UPI0022FE214B|nr:cytochrome P450 [Zychaea mexicana]KAI9497880.1 cytochrome P450 [Zychaea mexicana]